MYTLKIYIPIKANQLIPFFQDHWNKIEEAWDAELDSIQREIPKENGNGNNNHSEQQKTAPLP
jgi:hypothetical protein